MRHALLLLACALFSLPPTGPALTAEAVLEAVLEAAPPGAASPQSARIPVEPTPGLKQSPDEPNRVVVVVGGENFQGMIETTESVDLTQWAQEELAPVVEAWYPKIVEMLPSEDFEAPKSFRIIFSPRFRGVAATGGTRVMCNTEWFRNNLDGEAKGAIVHELVHVVQQYRRRGRRREDRVRPPGWLVEGIPDYIPLVSLRTRKRRRRNSRWPNRPRQLRRQLPREWQFSPLGAQHLRSSVSHQAQRRSARGHL